MEDSSDNEKSLSEEAEEVEEIEQEESEWGINYLDDKKTWDKYIIPEFCYQPKICPTCQRKTFNIQENPKKDILNPFIMTCSYGKCRRKKNIRSYSIFGLHKNLPGSVMLKIFQLFIIIKLNASQIYEKLAVTYKKKVSYITVCKVLSNIRHIIADYLKYRYRVKQIGGDPSLKKNVAIDESLYLKDDKGNKIWIVGAVDTDTKELRMDIMSNRNSSNLKIFITNHIIPGTNIIHDGWRGYAFLNSDNSVYTNEEYNHAYGNFGQGLHSTSHIESVWNSIKSEIKFLYRIIPHSNYIYYLRESEFRYIISKLSNTGKEKFLKKC